MITATDLQGRWGEGSTVLTAIDNWVRTGDPIKGEVTLSIFDGDKLIQMLTIAVDGREWREVESE